MGSFNVACFASRQTISSGDECVIMPIIQSASWHNMSLTHVNGEVVSQYGYFNNTCYPTAFWEVAGPIIKGRYDDYGSFELTKEKHNIANIILFFNHLHRKVYDVEEGKNPTHETALQWRELYSPSVNYSFDEICQLWATMWKTGQKSRLFMQDINGHPRSVGFAVMHQTTASYLVNMIEKGKTRAGHSLEMKEYFHHYLNEHATTLHKYVGNQESLAVMAPFIGQRIAFLENFPLYCPEGTSLHMVYNEAPEFVAQLISFLKDNPEPMPISRDYCDQLMRHISAHLEHRYIMAAMSSLNIHLAPMVYASQDNENSLGKAFLEMVSHVNSHVNKRAI